MLVSTNYIQKIFSFWGVRIIFFLLILSVTFALSNNPFIQLVLILIISLLIESLRVKSSFKTFGFTFDRDTILFILIGFFYTLLFFTTITILSQGVNGINLFAMVDEFNPNYFLGILLLIFFSALFEELIFRGILYQALLQRFGKYSPTLILSIFFVLDHIIFNHISDTIFIINIFLANLLLSLMYLRTGSLWLPLSFHFFWNLFQALILGSPVSGFYYGIEIFQTNLNHPILLINNQEIGIESSFICTIVFILTIPLFLKCFSINPFLKSIFFQRAYIESSLSENFLHKSKS